MSCDEIFSFYLFLVSQKVRKEYYLVVIKFILHFRDCLNKYGWEKKAENDEYPTNNIESTIIT
jgi:hypothetical protein